MKDFFLYLVSKTLWKNLAIMLILSILILVGIYFWLLSYTHHDEALTVPDFYGLPYKKAKKIAKKNRMELVILDTLEYDPDLPKFAIREQTPRKGDKVKSGRKIYVKINAARYRDVELPKLRGITLRQAKATLHALGLKTGKITKKPYFAEVVLDVIHGRDTLRRGDKLPRNSVVDIVVGSGEEEFKADTLSADSLQTSVQETNVPSDE